MSATNTTSPQSARDSVTPIGFNNTIRDAVQSLFGTNVPAAEIVASQKNAPRVGWNSIQVSGGTFFEKFVLQGRDPWEENRVLGAGFPGMVKTALWRGDFCVGYKRQPQEVIDLFVLKFAQAGINVLSNFHGMNDARLLIATGKAAQKARDQGYDIHVQAGICVEDNPNVQDLDHIYRTLETCFENGHRDVYFKSASGKNNPDFLYEATSGTKQRFDQRIFMHMHDTYGLGAMNYLAGFEGGADFADVLPDYIARHTGQPSITDTLYLIKKQGGSVLKERMPGNLDLAAMFADERAALEMAFRYRGFTARFNEAKFNKMFACNAAGGASATLRAIPQLENSLAGALKTKDWGEIEDAIYETQLRTWQALGYPTQVTPYAKHTTQQASNDIIFSKGQRTTNLTPDIIDLAVGRLGHVPEGIDPEIVRRARNAAGLAEGQEFKWLTAEELPPTIAKMRETLIAKGYEDPSEEDVLTAVMLSNPERQYWLGADFVVDKHKGVLKEKPAPKLPSYLDPATEKTNTADLSSRFVTDADDYKVAMAMGGAAGLEKLARAVLELQKKAYYKEKITHYDSSAWETPGRVGVDLHLHALRASQQEARDTVAKFMADARHGFASRFRDKHASQVTEAAGRILRDVCAAKGVTTEDLIPQFALADIEKALHNNNRESWQQYMSRLASEPGVISSPRFVQPQHIKTHVDPEHRRALRETHARAAAQPAHVPEAVHAMNGNGSKLNGHAHHHVEAADEVAPHGLLDGIFHPPADPEPAPAQ